MGDIQAGQRREFRTPGRSKHLSLLQCVQVRSGAHPASKVMCESATLPDSMEVITHLHLVTDLRMSAAMQEQIYVTLNYINYGVLIPNGLF
jgi:hypothetical protein